MLVKARAKLRNDQLGSPAVADVRHADVLARGRRERRPCRLARSKGDRCRIRVSGQTALGLRRSGLLQNTSSSCRNPSYQPGKADPTQGKRRDEAETTVLVGLHHPDGIEIRLYAA